MQAKRISVAQSANPLFDRAAARSAGRRGNKYDEPEYLTHHIGEIVDDSAAWMLCVFDQPVAVPHDDECRAKVASFRNSPKRKKFLAGLKKWHNNPSLVKQLSAAGQAYVSQMLESYANQLDATVEAVAATEEE